MIEFILILISFLSVILISYSFITYYIEYKERIRYEATVLTEYDLVRKRSFLGQMRPLLQFILKLDEKSSAISKWINNNYSKYDVILVKAGEPGGITGKEFLALKQISPVLLVSIIACVLAMPFSAVYVFFIVFGFILPDLWMNDQIKARQHFINRALPSALDAFSLVVGAGLTFVEAIDTYIEKGRKSPLAEEFSIVRDESRIGRTLAESLKAMADRIDSTALSDFVNIVIQSQRTGTSLAEVLSAQADDLRGKRFHAAEEMGQKATIKILFPLLLFIMPCVFIILFGPMILKFFYHQF
jgi:tight adherence protein C